VNNTTHNTLAVEARQEFENSKALKARFDAEVAAGRYVLSGPSFCGHEGDGVSEKVPADRDLRALYQESQSRLSDLLDRLVAEHTGFSGTFTDLVEAQKKHGYRPTFRESGNEAVSVLADAYDYVANLWCLEPSYRPERADVKKIAISPESSNHNDNDQNVAYLYRGYIIWKYTNEHGPLGGRSHEWHYGRAQLVTPDAALGEDFEPYWDDVDGRPQACQSRKDCLACIDRLLAQEPAPQADPDAEKNVTLTVSLNEARTILAALSRRCDELANLGGWQADELLAATRDVYHSVDRQTFQSKS
jgi:hypothetical protein